MTRYYLQIGLGQLFLHPEAEIERLDSEIAQTQQLLSSGEVASDYERLMELTEKLERLQKEQEALYEIWESLV